MRLPKLLVRLDSSRRRSSAAQSWSRTAGSCKRVCSIDNSIDPWTATSAARPSEPSSPRPLPVYRGSPEDRSSAIAVSYWRSLWIHSDRPPCTSPFAKFHWRRCTNNLNKSNVTLLEVTLAVYTSLLEFTTLDDFYLILLSRKKRAWSFQKWFNLQ